MTVGLGLALGVTLVLGAGSVVVEAQTSDGSGAGPSLGLEPPSGPAGTSVTAVVAGFGACQERGGSSQPADAVITWAGDPVGRVDLDGGTGRTSFSVPASAASEPHDVIAWCGIDDRINATASFAVQPAQEVRTVVPDVVGSSPDEATAAIDAAGLEVGRVTGDGEVVRTQDPPAATEVDAGTAVALELGVVTPQVDVEVPDLLGVDLGDVPAVLASRDLVLGAVSGEGDVVRAQEPASGTRVPSGSAVSVSVEPAVTPEVVVPVPDVVGRAADDARGALEAVGLVLGAGVEGDERVAAQDPPAGTLVALGSVVTVSAEVGATPTGTSVLLGPWLTVLAVVAALALAVWLARRLLRSRRDRRWVRRHVRVEHGATTSGRPVVHEDDDARATHVVRLEPHLDASPPTLEEVAP